MELEIKLKDRLSERDTDWLKRKLRKSLPPKSYHIIGCLNIGLAKVSYEKRRDYEGHNHIRANSTVIVYLDLECNPQNPHIHIENDTHHYSVCLDRAEYCPHGKYLSRLGTMQARLFDIFMGEKSGGKLSRWERTIQKYNRAYPEYAILPEEKPDFSRLK